MHARVRALCRGCGMRATLPTRTGGTAAGLGIPSHRRKVRLHAPTYLDGRAVIVVPCSACCGTMYQYLLYSLSCIMFGNPHCLGVTHYYSSSHSSNFHQIIRCPLLAKPSLAGTTHHTYQVPPSPSPAPVSTTGCGRTQPTQAAMTIQLPCPGV